MFAGVLVMLIMFGVAAGLFFSAKNVDALFGKVVAFFGMGIFSFFGLVYVGGIVANWLL